MKHLSHEEFVEIFNWDSETQKKGFLALFKDFKDKHFDQLNDLGLDECGRIEYVLGMVSCWFIQKDLESNEWYNQRIGDLDKKFTDTLFQLVQENRLLRNDIEELKEAVLKK